MVCRVFKKKSHLRVSDISAKESSSSAMVFKKEMLRSCSDGTLDQIIQFLSRSCKQETEFPFAYPVLEDGAVVNHTLHPRECPPPVDRLTYRQDDEHMLLGVDQMYKEGAEVNEWARQDRLVESQVDRQSKYLEEDGAFDYSVVNDQIYGDSLEYPEDMDLWACGGSADKACQSTYRG